MSFRTLFIIAFAFLSGSLQADPASTEIGKAASAKPSVQTLSAAVEEVVSSEEDGYRAIAYVVRWHGTRVLVVDTLAGSRLSVGDNLSFIAAHHDVSDKKILSFSAAACKCDNKSGKPPAAHSASSSAKTLTGLVEEVLSAEESGYRSVAYIVQAAGSRIAVSDPLAQSHHTVGENISFLALSNSAAGNPVMTFLAIPAKDATQAQQQTVSGQSEQTGVVEEVLTAHDGGFGYAAYILNALGARIAVEDVPGAMTHRVGDEISFLIERIDRPNSSRTGILRFEPRALQTDNQQSVNLSQTQETAAVEEVLALQTDGYRYVAYIVKWHGARVAVSDALSTTNYAVGDRISFPASRATSPGGRQLSFLLFSFNK